MTHTLHRKGDSESLKGDYVILVMAAKGFNDEGASPKLREALELMSNYSAVNIGDMRTGNIFKNSAETLFAEVKDTSIVHGVFKSREEMEKCIAELKRRDLGMSVVVSGLFDEVFPTLETVGLRPHTIQYSLGTFGNLSQLPSEDVLEITTMCGHHQVSPLLIRKLVSDVKRGKTDVREAAKTLAKQCVCGIFNPNRAETILQSMIQKQ